MTATLAFAAPPEPDDSVSAPIRSMVEKVLLKPLAAKEQRQSRLSRAMLPATARRVRVLDAAPQKDSEGKRFVTFAVDVRHGWDLDGEEGPDQARWQANEITGCGYPESGEVFIKRKGDYYGAAMLLGKKTNAAALQVCVGQTAQVATTK